MDIDTPKTWSDRGRPNLSAWRTRFETPSLAPDKPYLDTLPALITGTLLFLAASGLVLAVHYSPWHPYASIQLIRREVSSGWLIQSFHETGATMLFAAVYLLLFRGIFTRAYKGAGEFVWLATVALFCLLLLAGWLGYALTGGAVAGFSLAAATLSVETWTGLPGLLGSWFFGGPNGPGTLARLAMFHAVLGVAVFGLVALLHIARKAMTPAPAPRAAVGFHPHYTAQYFVAFTIFALIFAVLAFFAPHFGENPLNAIPASPMLMPAAPTPPWFLAPLSAVRVLLPGDAGGVIAVLAMLGLLFALPWLDRSGPALRTGFLHRFLVVVLALDLAALGIAAACRPSLTAAILQIVFALYYFLHFLVLTPLVTAMEAK
jgi:quinol-cytochrome oxidoreductase complex cytochrome b subunit